MSREISGKFFSELHEQHAPNGQNKKQEGSAIQPSYADESHLREDIPVFDQSRSEIDDVQLPEGQNSSKSEVIRGNQGPLFAEVHVAIEKDTDTDESLAQLPGTFVVAHMALVESSVKEDHQAPISHTIPASEVRTTVIQVGQEDNLQELEVPHIMRAAGENVQLEDEMQEFEVLETSSTSQDDVCASETNVCDNISDNLSCDAEDISKDSLLKEVQKMVSKLLPAHWFCSIKKDALLVNYSPVADHSLVQRSVSVGIDGHVSISVHSESLLSTHALWQKIPPLVPLEFSALKEFTNFVICIVGLLRKYHICPGLLDSDYSQFLEQDKSLIFDQNKFKETRYVTTHRSIDCLKLVSLQAKQCKLCSYLKKKLSFKLKRLNFTPSSKTSDRSLNTSKMRKQVFKERGSLSISMSRKEDLRSKIEIILKKNCIFVDNSLHEEISNILLQKRENVSEIQALFLEEQLKYSGCGMKWHPVLVRLALYMFSISPVAHLATGQSGILKLKSSRTLYDYSKFLKTSEGICAPTIQGLRKEIEGSKDSSHKEYHILIIDEITISQKLVFSKSTGELIGFTDLAEVLEELSQLENILKSMDSDEDMEEEEEEGNHSSSVGSSKERNSHSAENYLTECFKNKSTSTRKMLSYVVKGLSSDLKHVVGFYGVYNLTASDIFYKTWKVIGALEESDIYVLGVVCDGSPVNQKFVNMHEPYTKLRKGPQYCEDVQNEVSVIFDTKNLHSKDRVLYFFADIPYLFKTIRNCFWRSGLAYKKNARTLCKNNQTILWSTISELFQDKSDCEMHVAYKLNEQVVYLNSNSLMKVSLAVSVLNGTVADALEKTQDSSISETVEFIRRLSNFFECLNGSSIVEGVHKTNANFNPYTSVADERFEGLWELLKYLREWEVEIMSGPGSLEEKKRAMLTEQTLHDIEMTIRSFIGATKFLLETENVNSVMPRAFCQDPLEQYFCKNRASTGGTSKFQSNSVSVHLQSNLQSKS